MTTLQPCGTYGAYQRHKRAGEQPCEACAQARRDRGYSRKYRARQAAAKSPRIDGRRTAEGCDVQAALAGECTCTACTRAASDQGAPLDISDRPTVRVHGVTRWRTT